MVEHLVPVKDVTQQISSEWMHAKYTTYCKTVNMKRVAFSTKMGIALQRLYGPHSLRQKQVDGKPKYFYLGFNYLTESSRDVLAPRVTLPNFITMHIEHEILAMYYPTLMFFDGKACEFGLFYNSTTHQYWLRFRGIELNMKKLGLSSYTVFDQVFINGITRIINCFVLCSGRDVDLPPSPAGQKDSKVIFTHDVAELAPNGQIVNTKRVWFSKNCRGVMKLTSERNNKTCEKCVHDVNDRIRILKLKLLNDECEEDNTGDDDGDEDDSTSEEENASGLNAGGEASLNATADSSEPSGPVGGAKRMRGSASSSDSTSGEVSMFILFSGSFFLCIMN